MGKDKAKNKDFNDRKIARDKELLKNFKKYNISELKQEKLQAKIDKREADKPKYQ